MEENDTLSGLKTDIQLTLTDSYDAMLWILRTWYILGRKLIIYLVINMPSIYKHVCHTPHGSSWSGYITAVGILYAHHPLMKRSGVSKRTDGGGLMTCCPSQYKQGSWKLTESSSWIMWTRLSNTGARFLNRQRKNEICIMDIRITLEDFDALGN